jgi:hypothetical protein
MADAGQTLEHGTVLTSAEQRLQVEERFHAWPHIFADSASSSSGRMAFAVKDRKAGRFPRVPPIVIRTESSPEARGFWAKPIRFRDEANEGIYYGKMSFKEQLRALRFPLSSTREATPIEPARPPDFAPFDLAAKTQGIVRWD